MIGVLRNCILEMADLQTDWGQLFNGDFKELFNPIVIANEDFFF